MQWGAHLFSLLMFLFSSFNLLGQVEGFRDSALLNYGKKDYSKAIYWGEKYVEATKEKYGEQGTLYATAINNLGSFLFYNGNYQAAKKCYLESSEVYKKVVGEKDSNYIFIVNNIGNASEKLGQYKEAEKYFFTALSLQGEAFGQFNSKYAIYLTSLGLLYKKTGRYSESEKLYLQGLSISEKLNGVQSDQYILTLGNLAVLYFEIGKHSLAEKTLIQSVELKKRIYGEKNIEYGLALNNLAGIRVYLGNYKGAEPLLNEALVIFRSNLEDTHPLHATVIGNLAAIYYYLGKFELAEEYLKKQISIHKATIGEISQDYATSIYNLASVYRKIGNDTLAIKLHTQALGIRKAIFGINHIEYLQSLHNLAMMRTRTGDYAIADSLYIQALDIGQQNNMENNPFYLLMANSQCEFYLLTNRFQEAIKGVLDYLPHEEELLVNKLDFLSENELLAYLKDREYLFETPFSCLLYYNDPQIIQAAYNSRILLTGLSILNTSNLSKEILKSKDTILTKLYGEFRNNQLMLNKLLSMPLSKRELNSDSVKNTVNFQEKALLRQSATYRDMKNKINIQWQDLQINLQYNEAVVEFIRVRDVSKSLENKYSYSAILLLQKASTPIFVNLSSEEKLLNILSNFPYQGLENKRKIKAKSIINQKSTQVSLYKLLWGPLESHLKNVKTIYFSLDGLLHQVAFAAIPFRKDSILSDKYNLVQMTATRQIILNDTNKQVLTSIALFGGINYNKQNTDTVTIPVPDPYAYIYQQNRSADLDSFAYLSNTLREIVDIKKIMELKQRKVVMYRDDKATESAFRSLNGATSPVVIHFATHGFALPNVKVAKGINNIFKVSDNPLLRSGLIMAGGNNGWKGKNELDEDDGILTALEISSMYLPNTQLVVLSACETGVGELRGSEGVFGLQRAFKLAGVNYIMASLWPVPDKETNEFMNHFYGKWLSGSTIREAFLYTQHTMRKKYSPYYWAAFTLVQ